MWSRWCCISRRRWCGGRHEAVASNIFISSRANMLFTGTVIRKLRRYSKLISSRVPYFTMHQLPGIKCLWASTCFFFTAAVHISYRKLTSTACAVLCCEHPSKICLTITTFTHFNIKTLLNIFFYEFVNWLPNLL